MTAALRAGDVVVLYVLRHLLEGHALCVSAVVLDELIGSLSCVAVPAVHKGVGEAAHVTRRDPCLGVHYYRGVKSDVIGAFLNEFLPPRLLDVVLELDAEGTVVHAFASPPYISLPGYTKPRPLQRETILSIVFSELFIILSFRWPASAVEFIFAEIFRGFEDAGAEILVFSGSGRCAGVCILNDVHLGIREDEVDVFSEDIKREIGVEIVLVLCVKTFASE